MTMPSKWAPCLQLAWQQSQSGCSLPATTRDSKIWGERANTVVPAQHCRVEGITTESDLSGTHKLRTHVPHKLGSILKVFGNRALDLVNEFS